MLATHHGRDQIAYVKIGATQDGKITAFHTKILADLGAYLMLLTPTIPSLGAFVMSGVYDIPAVQTDIVGVFTNKMPTDAIRGAGPARGDAHDRGHARPARRRARDGPARAAPARTSSPPTRSRTRSRSASSTTPATTRARSTSCSSTSTSTRSAPRRRAAAQGHLRGIGFSTYTEICGLAPSRVTGPSGFGLQTGLWESAMVRVHITGAVTVYTGTSPHGQGLETTIAQIVADRLGIDPAERRGHPRRHRHRPAGARHLRLALARGRRRGGRPRDRQDRRQGAPDRRPPARGGGRGHRAARTASSPSRARRTRA